MGKTRNLHIELTDDFHRQLKVHCAHAGVSLKDFANEALQEKFTRAKAARR